MTASLLAVVADDGHAFELIARVPVQPTRSLLWLPALGISARHYVPFAETLAARGVAVFVHEWRGAGSSAVRAARARDWGYRELLTGDIAASQHAIAEALPQLPTAIGGHSLGGQLACLRLALAPTSARALWLVGSGAPYWRTFPAPLRLALPLAYRFMAWLADRAGALPGKRIGFGGNEARGVIRDWSRTGLSGRYAAVGIETDLEAALSQVDVEVNAIVLGDDWLAPEPSLRFLVGKLGGAAATIHTVDAASLGAPADHYAWMKHPAAVAALLAPSAR